MDNYTYNSYLYLFSLINEYKFLVAIIDLVNYVIKVNNVSYDK